MHEEIKNFSLTGEISDRNIVENKERLSLALDQMMRDKGYVQVLDLDPQFTLNYLPAREVYEFQLTLYGVHVGDDEVLRVAGMMSGKPILKYTQKSK